MKSAAQFSLVLVTAPDLKTARSLAKSALQARLIACASCALVRGASVSSRRQISRAWASGSAVAAAVLASVLAVGSAVLASVLASGAPALNLDDAPEACLPAAISGHQG